MKRKNSLPFKHAPTIYYAFLLYILIHVLISPVSAQSNWIGSVTINDTLHYTKFILQTENSSIRILPLNVVESDLTFKQSNNTISFENKDKTIIFNGSIKNNQLSGNILVNGQKGTAKLNCYLPLSEDEKREYSGMYINSANQLVSVLPYSDGIEVLNYTNGETVKCWRSAQNKQRFFQVIPVGRSFTQTPLKYISVSFTNEVIRIEQKPVIGLATSVYTGKKQTLFSNKEMIFKNDTFNIAGTLKLPQTKKGKLPLLVIVPGSGDLQRDFYAHITHFFASSGMAVFSYDKRGTGFSNGDFNTADFDALASDINAVVNGLAHHEKIDPSKIFLWGHSQGGWIAPLVANNTNKIAGIISVSGSTDMPGVQTTFWVENYLRIANYSEKQVRDAVNWMNLITKVMDAKGEGYEEIEKRLPEIKIQPWQNFVTIPSSKEDLLSWGGYYYDPIPVLNKMNTPILALFGEKDINVNAVSNSKVIQSIIQSKHLSSSFVHIFPNADHDIALTLTGNRDIEWLFQSKYSPNYFKMMKDWLFKICSDINDP